ncbi:MAG: asparagine synthase-related protein [Bacillota bacterium]
MILAADLTSRTECERLVSERTGLQPVFSGGQISALANPACSCIRVADRGCILGSLFRRHGPAEALAALQEGEPLALANGGGQTLIGSYWGGYVAAITKAEHTSILRDPSGTFSCYYVTAPGVAMFASDAELLTACGIALDIDVEEVGRQLYRAFVPSPATAVRGIHELLAGFELRFPSAMEIQQARWSPWDHVSDPGVPPVEAAERLARTVCHCVQSWASTRHRLLLSVSGGLDSSIVAACFAKGGGDLVCLTMFTDDAAGDERPFARALCDHLGLRLVERPYRLEDIDITEPLAAHLPRPRDRTQALAYERMNLEVAAEVGADGFVTGNGGDNVMGYSQSAAPIADRYLVEGVGEGLFRSLGDVCRQTGCSVFDAVRQAWRLAHGSPRHRIRPNALLLHPDFVRGLGMHELCHPWLDPPASALPGKSAHISSILRAQPILEAARGYYWPVFSPLVSQPLIEACLAVPSWEWRAGGRDRSLARRAFAAQLPPLVLNRRVKGTPGRFAARLLEHFRGPIRERLLGGRLAEAGIVDPAAIGRLLADERPVPDLERVRILELVNAEAWMDHWFTRPATEPGPLSISGLFDGPPRLAGGPIP